MNKEGHLRDMQGLSQEQIAKFHDEGYRPINEENVAQAGMLLHGEKETKVDPSLFKSWTTKKRNKHLKKRMKQLNKAKEECK